MKKALLASLLILAPAAARAAGCYSTTGPFPLQKVRTTASGLEMLACINQSFDALSSSSPFSSTFTHLQGLDLGVDRIYANHTQVEISSPALFDQDVTMSAALHANADTAGALHAAGAPCVNQAAKGTDAAGNAVGCFTTALPGDVTAEAAARAAADADLYAVKLATGVPIPGSLIPGTTYNARIDDLYSVKLSTGVQVPLALLSDLYNTKLSTGVQIPLALLLDIYAAKLSTGVAVPGSLIPGTTYNARIDDLYNVKLSTGVQIPLALLTDVYGAKLSTGVQIPLSLLLDIYAAKLSSGVAIPGSLIPGTTYNARIDDLYTVKLSTGVQVPLALLTDIYNAKLSTGVQIPLALLTDIYGAKLSTGVAVPGSLISGTTYNTRIDDLYNVKLSTGVQIPLALLTDIYNAKLSTGVQIPLALLADIYGAKLSTGVAIDPGLVNTSTLAPVGLSSACPAGQFWDQTNINKGSINGGHCTAAGAGTITGGGTAPLIPVYSGAAGASTALGNSTLSQDGAASVTLIGSTLTVGGAAFQVGGGFNTNASSTSIGGALAVTGQTAHAASITLVSSSMTLTGSGGKLDVGGQTTLRASLTVASTVTIQGAQTDVQELTAIGTMTVQGTAFQVGGNFNTNSSSASFGGALAVAGQTAIAASLTLAGSSATLTGAGGKLDVGGQLLARAPVTIINSTLTVQNQGFNVGGAFVVTSTGVSIPTTFSVGNGSATISNGGGSGGILNVPSQPYAVVINANGSGSVIANGTEFPVFFDAGSPSNNYVNQSIIDPSGVNASSAVFVVPTGGGGGYSGGCCVHIVPTNVTSLKVCFENVTRGSSPCLLQPPMAATSFPTGDYCSVQGPLLLSNDGDQYKCTIIANGSAASYTYGGSTSSRGWLVKIK